MYDFFDKDHANNYLAGTIVRHDGKPTLVQAVERARNGRFLVHHSLLRAEEITVDKIEEFDLKPVPLGMYNFRVGGVIVEAAWLQRMPQRRWKVGLDRAAVGLIPVRKADDNVIFDILRDQHMRNRWAYSVEMADCIE